MPNYKEIATRYLNVPKKPTETVAQYEQRTLKTPVQYMEEAEKEITLANMEAELKKIQEELEQELSGEQ